jgi:hypothetical protein
MSGEAVAEKFGKCCEELKEALDGSEFEPMITTGEDGILYMAVGFVELEDDEAGTIDHPLFFCPFCGTKVQDKDEVMAKLDAADQAAGNA